MFYSIIFFFITNINFCNLSYSVMYIRLVCVCDILNVRKTLAKITLHRVLFIQLCKQETPPCRTTFGIFRPHNFTGCEYQGQCLSVGALFDVLCSTYTCTKNLNGTTSGLSVEMAVGGKFINVYGHWRYVWFFREHEWWQSPIMSHWKEFQCLGQIPSLGTVGMFES